MKNWINALKKDAWLAALLGFCLLCCLLLKGTDASPGTSTAEEARLSQVLSSIAGAGQVEVAVFYERDDASLPCGAVIVADGAKDVTVQLRLTRAVMTLLNLNAEQIEIFQRREE